MTEQQKTFTNGSHKIMPINNNSNNNFTLQKESNFQLMKSENGNLANFSFFSKEDKVSFYFYTVQQVQMWLSGEIPYSKDISSFNNLNPRLKRLIEEILGFFAPADGLVNASILRQLTNSKSSMELAFLFFQAANECVHQEVYGRFIKMFAKDVENEKRIFNMVNDVPCVRRKANFIKKYIDADIAPCLFNLAQACAEGIFFVSLFAIIFIFRRLGGMEAFIFANEQIQKDETTHRDYYCAKAEENGIKNYFKEALQIIEEAVDVEIEFIKYLLRDPIQEVDIDEIMGLTVENLSDYARLLADQILVFCGLEIRYNVSPKLSWMEDLGLQKKNNFYERKVGNYKKASFEDQFNWKKSIGMEDESAANGVEDPTEVEF